MFAGAFTITTPEHLHSPVMKPKKTFNALHYLHTFVITSSSGLSIACLTSPYEKVNRITGNNINARIDEGNKKDEVAKLAITFNAMLDRLKHSLDNQKYFSRTEKLKTSD